MNWFFSWDLVRPTLENLCKNRSKKNEQGICPETSGGPPCFDLPDGDGLGQVRPHGVQPRGTIARVLMNLLRGAQMYLNAKVRYNSRSKHGVACSDWERASSSWPGTLPGSGRARPLAVRPSMNLESTLNSVEWMNRVSSHLAFYTWAQAMEYSTIPWNSCAAAVQILVTSTWL